MRRHRNRSIRRQLQLQRATFQRELDEENRRESRNSFVRLEALRTRIAEGGFVSGPHIPAALRTNYEHTLRDLHRSQQLVQELTLRVEEASEQSKHHFELAAAHRQGQQSGNSLALFVWHRNQANEHKRICDTLTEELRTATANAAALLEHVRVIERRSIHADHFHHETQRTQHVNRRREVSQRQFLARQRAVQDRETARELTRRASRQSFRDRPGSH